MVVLTICILIILFIIWVTLTDILSQLVRLNEYIDFLEQRDRAIRKAVTGKEDDVVMDVDGYKIRKSQLYKTK